MWPYLLHYPGVLALQSSTVHDARRARLVHEGRQADYANGDSPSQADPRTSVRRGTWREASGRCCRVPVTASRITVVADPALASDLASTMPEARVRVVAAGVVAARGHRAPRPSGAGKRDGGRRRNVTPRGRWSAPWRACRPTVRPSTLPAGRASPTPTSWWRSDGRCRAGRSSRRYGGWRRASPRSSPRPTARRTGLPSTPRRGRVRDQARTANDPVVVSIDPRDEEHSLVLALRRLATDARLRADLGALGTGLVGRPCHDRPRRRRLAVSVERRRHAARPGAAGRLAGAPATPTARA